MTAETTHLKNTTPAEDFNKTDKKVIGQSNITQYSFYNIAGSLLALLVLFAVAGNCSGHYFEKSASKIDIGAGARVDYQVVTANSALTMDIFGMSAISDNEEGCKYADCACCGCDHYCGCPC